MFNSTYRPPFPVRDHVTHYSTPWCDGVSSGTYGPPVSCVIHTVHPPPSVTMSHTTVHPGVMVCPLGHMVHQQAVLYIPSTLPVCDHDYSTPWCDDVPSGIYGPPASCVIHTVHPPRLWPWLQYTLVWRCALGYLWSTSKLCYTYRPPSPVCDHDYSTPWCDDVPSGIYGPPASCVIHTVHPSPSVTMTTVHPGVTVCPRGPMVHQQAVLYIPSTLPRPWPCHTLQ